MPAGAGDEPTPCRIASQAFTALRPEIARPLSHGGRSIVQSIKGTFYPVTVTVGCELACNI